MTRAPAVRPATSHDAERLAALADQLGYRVEPEWIRERLPEIAAQPDAAVVLAASDDGAVIGWIHVEMKRSLLAPLGAQVMGLVVDEAHRGRGIGARLLGWAEGWATERGCREILVASRISRDRAHDFYRRQGYELLKTSLIFRKDLS